MSHMRSTAIARVMLILACAAVALAALARVSHRSSGISGTFVGRTAAVSAAVRNGRVVSFEAGPVRVRCASGYTFDAKRVHGARVEQSGARFAASGTARI